MKRAISPIATRKIIHVRIKKLIHYCIKSRSDISFPSQLQSVRVFGEVKSSTMDFLYNYYSIVGQMETLRAQK